MHYWKIILAILILASFVFFVNNLLDIFTNQATWMTILNLTLQFLGIAFGLMVLGNSD